MNWNSLTHGLSNMPHTCALAVSKNALKIGMDAFCAVVSTSTQTNTNHNPPKLEVPFPDTRVLLTCSVRDNYFMDVPLSCLVYVLCSDKV